MAQDLPVLVDDLDRHPAVAAWRAIDRGNRLPQAVQVLQQHKKSDVFCLQQALPSGAGVIAKRGTRDTARLERTMYEEVLPTLPISALRYYGYLEAGDGAVWIFIEDAGGLKFSAAEEAHRILAAHWLGALHSSAGRTSALEILPRRDPSSCLEMLRAGRANIRKSFINPAMSTTYVDELEEVVALLDRLEAHWPVLEASCRTFPSTLVHGDWRPKNVRVRQTEQGTRLYVMDWETAGWGVPAVDLANSHGPSDAPLLDLSVYHAIVGKVWPDLDLRTLHYMTHIGRILRRVVAIYWASLGLDFAWIEKNMLRMRIYREELDQALTDVFGERRRDG